MDMVAEPRSASFFFPSPLPFGGSTVLSLTRGTAGNRTTTGLSATSRTPRYQLSHEDDYVVTRERAADDVRGVLRMLRESIGERSSHKTMVATKRSLQTLLLLSLVHSTRRLEPDEPNFLFSA